MPHALPGIRMLLHRETAQEADAHRGARYRPPGPGPTRCPDLCQGPVDDLVPRYTRLTVKAEELGGDDVVQVETTDRKASCRERV